MIESTFLVSPNTHDIPPLKSNKLILNLHRIISRYSLNTEENREALLEKRAISVISSYRHSKTHDDAREQVNTVAQMILNTPGDHTVFETVLNISRKLSKYPQRTNKTDIIEKFTIEKFATLGPFLGESCLKHLDLSSIDDMNKECRAVIFVVLSMLPKMHQQELLPTVKVFFEAAGYKITLEFFRSIPKEERVAFFRQIKDTVLLFSPRIDRVRLIETWNGLRKDLKPEMMSKLPKILASAQTVGPIFHLFYALNLRPNTIQLLDIFIEMQQYVKHIKTNDNSQLAELIRRTLTLDNEDSHLLLKFLKLSNLPEGVKTVDSKTKAFLTLIPRLKRIEDLDLPETVALITKSKIPATVFIQALQAVQTFTNHLKNPILKAFIEFENSENLHVKDMIQILSLIPQTQLMEAVHLGNLLFKKLDSYNAEIVKIIMLNLSQEKRKWIIRALDLVIDDIEEINIPEILESLCDLADSPKIHSYREFHQALQRLSKTTRFSIPLNRAQIIAFYALFEKEPDDEIIPFIEELITIFDYGMTEEFGMRMSQEAKIICPSMRYQILKEFYANHKNINKGEKIHPTSFLYEKAKQNHRELVDRTLNYLEINWEELLATRPYEAMVKAELFLECLELDLSGISNKMIEELYDTRYLATQIKEKSKRLNEFRNPYRLYQELKNSILEDKVDRILITPPNHSTLQLNLSVLQNISSTPPLTTRDLFLIGQQKPTKDFLKEMEIHFNALSYNDQCTFRKNLIVFCFESGEQKPFIDLLERISVKLTSNMFLVNKLQEKIEERFAHPEKLDTEISPLEYYLLISLKAIEDQPQQIIDPSESLLYEREKLLLSFYNYLRNCTTGQKEGLIKFFHDLPEEYNKNHKEEIKNHTSDNKEVIDQILLSSLQSACNNVFSAEQTINLLLKRERTCEVIESPHQTLFIKNRYRKYFDPTYKVEFDYYSGCILKELLQLPVPESLTILGTEIYLKLRQELKDTIIDIFTNDNDPAHSNPIHLYQILHTYLESVIPQPEQQPCWEEKYFIFNEDYLELGITDLCANRILKAEGYISDEL